TTAGDKESLAWYTPPTRSTVPTPPGELSRSGNRPKSNDDGGSETEPELCSDGDDCTMLTKRHGWGALLLLISPLILAACGAGPVSHPTGARDIILRQSGTGGGMLPGRLYYYEGQFPPFTLFGDGTLVYTGNGGFYQAHLDEAAIQRLLTLAVNDVHFF